MAGSVTYRQVEIITGPARRRRFSLEEKLRLVEEAFAPGVNASEVARRHGVHGSLLFRWRRQYRRGQRVAGRAAAPAFVPVRLAAEPTPCPGASAASEPSGLIEIVLPGGAMVRVDRPGPVP